MIAVFERPELADLPPFVLAPEASRDPGGLPWFELALQQFEGEPRCSGLQQGSHAKPPAGESAAPEITDPVRVHASWCADGVRVWIGADAKLRDRLSLLAQQVHRSITARGYHVLALYCNGSPMGATAQEEIPDGP